MLPGLCSRVCPARPIGYGCAVCPWPLHCVNRDSPSPPHLAHGGLGDDRERSRLSHRGMIHAIVDEAQRPGTNIHNHGPLAAWDRSVSACQGACMQACFGCTETGWPALGEWETHRFAGRHGWPRDIKRLNARTWVCFYTYPWEPMGHDARDACPWQCNGLGWLTSTSGTLILWCEIPHLQREESMPGTNRPRACSIGSFGDVE